MDIPLSWLNQPPKEQQGFFVGVPWKRGEIPAADLAKITCQSQGRKQRPQSKVMAYWPDGSLKWSGHYLQYVGDEPPSLRLGAEMVEKEIASSMITQGYNGILVDTGSLQAFFPNRGSYSLAWVKRQKTLLLTKLCPLVKAENISRSEIVEAVVEEEGECYVAVKTVMSFFNQLKGEIFRVILRFGFWRSQDNIEITATLVLMEEEPLGGFGLGADIPLQGEAWNRYFQFCSTEFVYCEPAQTLLSRYHSRNNIFYQKQCHGERLEREEIDDSILDYGEENPLWQNFSLYQESPKRFCFFKSTGDHVAEIKGGEGEQSSGVIYAGGRDGGLAIGIKDFWQKYPAELQVKNLADQNSQIAAWFLSPRGGFQTFQHYSQRDHMRSAYEGFAEIRSTAEGIANTSSLTLEFFDQPIRANQLLELAQRINYPPRLICSPERYQASHGLGRFSLITEANEAESFLEKQLVQLFDFYRDEVVQRSWYGFWDYGDVMHTYDPVRSQWRYDLGGYAWQNTELVPNMWLWQYFLRSGREDVFTLAEAMTRHTSEVDCYHEGTYKGLGSRHNVLHWGCSCKEVRIAMAALHRYYYYLTGDARIGEILQVTAESELAIQRLPPLREFYKKQDGLIPIRTGPDWAALASGWFTAWERSGETKWSKKLCQGVADIKRSPLGLLSGPSFLFRPEDGGLTYMGSGNESGYHMVIAFGATQFWIELADSLEDRSWKDMLAEFGWFYSLSDAEKKTHSDGLLENKHFSWPMFAAGMIAYSAYWRKDPLLARKAWELLLFEKNCGVPLPIVDSMRESSTWEKVREIPWISTNCVSQWCLNVMLCLELIPEALPEVFKEWEEGKSLQQQD